MIATIQEKDSPAPPCIVQWTGKKNLISVGVRAYCGDEFDASLGVFQLPDKTMTIPGMLCPRCIEAYRKYEAMIK